jgi:hypothetical protein
MSSRGSSGLWNLDMVPSEKMRRRSSRHSSCFSRSRPPTCLVIAASLGTMPPTLLCQDPLEVCPSSAGSSLLAAAWRARSAFSSRCPRAGWSRGSLPAVVDAARWDSRHPQWSLNRALCGHNSLQGMQVPVASMLFSRALDGHILHSRSRLWLSQEALCNNLLYQRIF